MSSARIDNGKESAMKRSLCAFALLALVAIPDWASACWLRGRIAQRRAAMGRPVARQPITYRPTYQRVPVMPPMIQQPQVESVPPMQPTRRKGSDASAPEPFRPIARPEVAPVSEPIIEPIRPILGSEPTKPMQPAKPEAAPADNDPKLTPFEHSKTEVPKNEPPKNNTPEPKVPAPEPPKTGGEPKLPPLELPTKPDAKSPLPEPLKDTGSKPPVPDMPKGTGADPKVPPVESPGGTAVPVPAPPPDILTPPGGGTSKDPNSLPPLVLPPESPAEPMKPSIAKSSPLTSGREMKVSVFTASGSRTAGGLYKIGFYNHTDRSLVLTIEGKTVTLPAKTYLHAQVASTFTWKYGDKPATTANVPAGAAGLDVLFRE